MLLDSGAKKLMVCAPSNAAIDEIVGRISRRGFIGSPDRADVDSILASDDGSAADGLLLRLGAADYEPSPEVKRHTLDERLADTMNGKRAFLLREKIDSAHELLEELAKELGSNQGQLSSGNKRHIECVMRVLGASLPKSAKAFIKRNKKEDHVQVLKKQLANSEAKLRELLEGEHQKQVRKTIRSQFISSNYLGRRLEASRELVIGEISDYLLHPGHLGPREAGGCEEQH